MKRYFIYIIMFVTALFVGCTTTEPVIDTPEMTEVGDIEVTFSVDGEEVRALDLASVSHTIKVDVALNNEGVYWTPVSDQEWCQIVAEEHRGSGSFTLVINANDSFDAREDATITFKAGEYERDMLTVTHNGNVFVINQVYSVSTKAAGSATILVETIEGVEWDVTSSEWMTATKGASSTADGKTITELSITWADNADASRYGTVSLIKSGKSYAEGWFNVWQFGTDVAYDAEGFILLVAQDAEPLEIRAPRQTIKEFSMPSWVTCEEVENSDNTVSYMLQFGDNPSDAKHIRVTELAISFLSGAADIALPVIKQEYYAMEGLLTGPGLALFAKTWNEGGDVSQWYVDGVPTLVQDIDLTEVKDWVSIGTAEHPWTGEFNGNGKKLINLTATQPIFGIVENGVIKNLTIGDSSSFRFVGEYSADLHLAALAGLIKGTTLENCANNGSVALEASNKEDSCKAYVAALAAQVDATSAIKNCSNSGSVSVPNSCSTTDSSTFYVGSFAGYSEGIVEDCFNNGAVEGSAQADTSYVGGLVGYNAPKAIVRNSHNAGAITYKASRGNNVSLYGYVGGISGIGNGEISGNTNEGDITSTSNIQELYMGGIVGAVLGAEVKLENNSQANASDLKATGKARYSYIGGFAGYIGEEAVLSFDFTKDTGTFAGTIHAGNAEANSEAIIAAGGFVGYTESTLTINGINYDGTITMDLTDVTTGDYYTFGGLVGRAAAPLTITSSTTSGTMDVPATTVVPKAKISNGGLVGLCEADVTIKSSTNNIPIEFKKSTPSKSNSIICHLGGIVGRILSGKALIEDCHNKGKITNLFYNNNLFHDLDGSSADGKIAVAAGVLGSYGYLVTPTDTDELTIKDCTNTHPIVAYRGGVAGIAGYVRNAVVDGCTYLNGRSDSQNNSYAGGIICIAANSTIKNCKATVDIVSKPAGSLYIRTGGIVAWLRGESTVESCQFFGNLSYTASAEDDFCGGIVGLAEDEECEVKDCALGGTITGTTITANNCADYAVGAGSLGNYPVIASVSNISYWNGK